MSLNHRSHHAPLSRMYSSRLLFMLACLSLLGAIPVVNTQEEQPGFFPHAVVRVQTAVEDAVLDFIRRNLQPACSVERSPSILSASRVSARSLIESLSGLHVQDLEVADVALFHGEDVLRRPYPLVAIALALLGDAHGPSRAKYTLALSNSSCRVCTSGFCMRRLTCGGRFWVLCNRPVLFSA